MNDDNNNFQRFFIAKHRNFLRGICHPWHIRSYTDSIIFAKFHARKEKMCRYSVVNVLSSMKIYDSIKNHSLLHIIITRKHSLCRYILGMLAHTAAWDQHLVGGDETLK